jgi:NAD(P)-dependent dehydrogenase (short-subunit alcohol dehydrogenase family)
MPKFTLPDLSGRTAIVTGAGSGIGLATARALTGAGARVVFAVRDQEKGRAAARQTPGETEVRRLDLASLDAVREFAAHWHDPIDLLINNAGTWSRDLRHTADGFELQFGTNHLGHFALTNLLLGHVTGRVVTLSSQAERAGRTDFDDPRHERSPYRPSAAYNRSKLANLLFSAELQRRLDRSGSAVRSLAAHPGYVATPIYDGSGTVARFLAARMAQSPQQGALPVLYAATADLPGDSFTGPEHLMHMRGGATLIGRSRHAADPEPAARLWDLSARLTGVTFPQLIAS